MKYCKDCFHIDYGQGTYWMCRAIIVAQGESPVTGPWTELEKCQNARLPSGKCGPEAKLFTPRPVMDELCKL